MLVKISWAISFIILFAQAGCDTAHDPFPVYVYIINNTQSEFLIYLDAGIIQWPGVGETLYVKKFYKTYDQEGGVFSADTNAQFAIARYLPPPESRYDTLGFLSLVCKGLPEYNTTDDIAGVKHYAYITLTESTPRILDPSSSNSTWCTATFIPK